MILDEKERNNKAKLGDAIREVYSNINFCIQEYFHEQENSSSNLYLWRDENTEGDENHFDVYKLALSEIAWINTFCNNEFIYLAPSEDTVAVFFSLGSFL